MIALGTSPGNFHAATALLPSSFDMYTAMLGASTFVIWQGGAKTARGLHWFAAGAVFGWPFSAALCAPFVVEDVLLAFSRGKAQVYEMFVGLFRGAVGAALMIVREAFLFFFPPFPRSDG